MEKGTLYTFAQHTLTTTRNSRIPRSCTRLPQNDSVVTVTDNVDITETSANVSSTPEPLKRKVLETGCFGCTNDCGGQRDHMGTGGCLEVPGDHDNIEGSQVIDDERDCFSIENLDCINIIRGPKVKKSKVHH